MLFALGMMNVFGVSANLMSLGAIDFGLIVDGAVIIVEAVFHRISSNHLQANGNKLSQKQMDKTVFECAKQMMSSASFGQIIILIVYLPLLSLIGIEGKMFRPMAQTVSFAILGAFILSLTYIPMASALLLSKKTTHKKNISDRMMDFFSAYTLRFLKNQFAGKELLSWQPYLFLRFLFSSFQKWAVSSSPLCRKAILLFTAYCHKELRYHKVWKHQCRHRGL